MAVRFVLKAIPEGEIFQKPDGWYKKTSTGAVKIAKDKAGADKYKERMTQNRQTEQKVKKPEVGDKVRIKGTAKNIGRGIVAKIKEIGKDFVRVITDPDGDIYRVKPQELAFAKSTGEWIMTTLLKARTGLVPVKKQVTTGKGKTYTQTVWVKPGSKTSGGGIAQPNKNKHIKVYSEHMNKLVSQAAKDIGITEEEVLTDDGFMRMIRKDARNVANEKAPLNGFTVPVSESLKVTVTGSGVIRVKSGDTDYSLTSLTLGSNTAASQFSKDFYNEWHSTGGDVAAAVKRIKNISRYPVGKPTPIGA